MGAKKTDEERAAQLRDKVAKLRKLAEGAGPEAKLAGEKAEALDRELAEVTAKTEKAQAQRRRPRRVPPVAVDPPRPRPEPAPALVCVFDEEPVVQGEVLMTHHNRYFQVAEHAARWSGVLLHIDRKWLRPYALFFGPREQIAKAWSRYGKVRKAFDRKFAIWKSRLDYDPTGAECDRYARGFLDGLDEHEREKEAPEARRAREILLRRCDAAYQQAL